MPDQAVIWSIVQALIEMFARHHNGENVSADLDALQAKVKALLQHEQDIADGK